MTEFRPVIKSDKRITPSITSFLNDVMAAAKIPECYVTSVARSPKEQATAMFDNCLRTGVADQYSVYRESGDAVIEVFETYFDRDATYLKTPAGRAECIKAMVDKINEIGPSKVSHHCLGPDSPLEVIDILQSSIEAEARFLQAVRKHPRYIKDLVENRVYHLEFSKAAAPGVQS